MRRMFTRLVHSPAVWYGFLCWLLLVLSLVLPSAWRFWSTGVAEGPFSNDSSVQQLAFFALIIGFGAAAAWHRRRVGDAVAAVTCAVLAFWVVEWAAMLLPQALIPTQHSITEPQEQSYYVNGAVIDLILRALLLFAPGGAIFGACGGLIGKGLHQLERRLREPQPN